jgi:hypothetical protein
MFEGVVSGRLFGFNLGDWTLLIGGCLVSGMLAFLMCPTDTDQPPNIM